MGTYFAYTRVSTPRQGEKGVSLSEQKAAIERYARQHGLDITRWFEEQQSASQTGHRPTFTQMLKLLRKGAAQGVIIHKIDRSARNLEDWADVGKLADAGMEVHFANESVDLKTVAGRLSADIQAVVAAHYSRNLREEVKKGFYGRLKQGYYPLRAPIGYLDQGSAKPKIPDPDRAPLVRLAFELYSSGAYSIPQLAREMFRRGLRNRKGGAVSVNGLAKALKNPFYIGLLRIFATGQMYQGNQEPLISASTFETVQSVLAGKRVDRVGHTIFTYSRLVRCKTCGYSLIAELKKGHVYYRCHNRVFKNPQRCPTTSIREESIEEVILNCLSEVELGEQELRLARSSIERVKQELEATRNAATNALRLQLQSTERMTAKLTDLLIEGTVDKDLFENKRRQILFEQARAKEQLAGIEQNKLAGIERIEKAVELARSPSLLFKQVPIPKRREFLKAVLSNLSASGKNVEVTLTPAFALIAERKKHTDGGPYRGTCRTWTELTNKLLNLFEKQHIPAN